MNNWKFIKTNKVLKVLKVSTSSTLQLPSSLYMAMWTSCRLLRCPNHRGAHITLSKRKSVDEHENALSFMAQHNWSTSVPIDGSRYKLRASHTWYLVRSQEAWWDSPGEEIPSSSSSSWSTDDYGHLRNLPTHVFLAWCDVRVFFAMPGCAFVY